MKTPCKNAHSEIDFIKTNSVQIKYSNVFTHFRNVQIYQIHKSNSY